MTTILDRQLILSYLKSYVICFVSLMSMFIIVDLFQNIDNFLEANKGGKFFPFLALYYSQKSMLIFDRMSEAIVLMAAMFTVAWMQRNNEILPLLSAGVSTRRVVTPVLFAAFGMISLTILNQELVLPNIDPNIVENRGDAKGDKQVAVKGGLYESNGILIQGSRGIIKGDDQIVTDFNASFPIEPPFQNLPMLQAKEARYREPGDGRTHGGWELFGTVPAQAAPIPDLLENPHPGHYFLRTSEVDFKSLTRPKNWYAYVSTWELLDALDSIDPRQHLSVAVIFHTRFARPVLGMLLVFMGLSIILRDQNRNVIISTGMSLGLCSVFFLAGMVCRHVGDAGWLAPVAAAWLPVVLFGPLSFVMFDAVHT